MDENAVILFRVDDRKRKVGHQPASSSASGWLAVKRVGRGSLGSRLDLSSEPGAKAFLDGFVVRRLTQKLGPGVLGEAGLSQGAIRLASANTSSAA